MDESQKHHIEGKKWDTKEYDVYVMSTSSCIMSNKRQSWAMIIETRKIMAWNEGDMGKKNWLWKMHKKFFWSKLEYSVSLLKWWFYGCKQLSELIKLYSNNLCILLCANKTIKISISSRKTSISALLTVWITINCGKFWKRWAYQTTWPASWETCM